jgi:hypothetical protein
MGDNMCNLEAQFHPGYEFPHQSSVIDYFDSIPDLSDLLWPGDLGYDSDSTTSTPLASALEGDVNVNRFFENDNIFPEVADIDATESQLLDTSTPQVPVAPVPSKEILPQGNGPGLQSTVSYKPPQPPPRHGGWWFHVDTGANVHVSYFPAKLAHRIHYVGHCGTAGNSSMEVACEGMWILQGTPSNCPEFHAVLTALGCPGAKRRSFSLHAMARSGYDCVHHVRSHAQVTHRATNTSYRLSCTTFCETDFIELMPCKAALRPQVYSEINAIDLAKTIKGPALFHLLHLSVLDVKALKY